MLARPPGRAGEAGRVLAPEHDEPSRVYTNDNYNLLLLVHHSYGR